MKYLGERHWFLGRWYRFIESDDGFAFLSEEQIDELRAAILLRLRGDLASGLREEE